MTPQADVVVIGAGPTGLLIAAELRRGGAHVELIEARSDGVPGSRAIGVHPPVLRALAASGVTDRILEHATRVPRGEARSGGSTLGVVRFDALRQPYPFVATVPQAVTEASVAFGGPAVRRGVKVTAVRDRGDHVELTVVSAGESSELTASLVVVAAGTAGRALAPPEASVQAHAYRDVYLMADVTDAAREPEDTAVIRLERTGVLESFPLPNGGRRLVAWSSAAPRGAARLPDDDEIRRERLSRFVEERTGDSALSAAVRSATVSAFGIRRALARRMRVGRVLLIGDAAHEVSPIGGQGMNLGLLDAVTAAPLLLRWLDDDREPESGLSRWEYDRRASARTALRLAGMNTALGRPRGRIGHTAAVAGLSAVLGSPAAGIAARAYAMGFDRAAAQP